MLKKSICFPFLQRERERERSMKKEKYLQEDNSTMYSIISVLSILLSRALWPCLVLFPYPPVKLPVPGVEISSVWGETVSCLSHSQYAVRRSGPQWCGIQGTWNCPLSPPWIMDYHPSARPFYCFKWCQQTWRWGWSQKYYTHLCVHEVEQWTDPWDVLILRMRGIYPPSPPGVCLF